MSKISFVCVVKDGCKSNFVLSSMEDVVVNGKNVSAGFKVNATPAGKLRQHDIFISQDDRVTVEVDSSDITRGRITRRL